jgi:hypothetical protein
MRGDIYHSGVRETRIQDKQQAVKFTFKLKADFATDIGFVPDYHPINQQQIAPVF